MTPTIAGVQYFASIHPDISYLDDLKSISFILEKILDTQCKHATLLNGTFAIHMCDKL